jgi:hypothetical protein
LAVITAASWGLEPGLKRLDGPGIAVDRNPIANKELCFAVGNDRLAAAPDGENEDVAPEFQIPQGFSAHLLVENEDLADLVGRPARGHNVEKIGMTGHQGEEGRPVEGGDERLRPQVREFGQAGRVVDEGHDVLDAKGSGLSADFGITVVLRRQNEEALEARKLDGAKPE